MTVKQLALALAIEALTACSLNAPHYTSDDQPDAAAGEAPDAQTTCEPSTIVCDEATGLYIDCSAAGDVSFEMRCPLGCASDAEKCLDVDPSNGLAVFLDMTADAPEVEFSGSSSIDTGNGTVFNGGVSIEVPSTEFNGMRVFMFRTLKISGTLEVVRGTPFDEAGPALVFLADGDVVIDGILDVSADSGSAGPAGVTSSTCIGGRADGIGGVSGGGGGGGAVYTGGIGGAPGDGAAAAAGGQAVAAGDSLDPLVGGCNGGGVTEGTPKALGGGGGGAVQIVSRTRISLLTTGAIDASGGGGSPGTNSGGGGGGSGGAVLLEAPQVVLDGSVAISTKGGSGAAANTTGSTASGSDGGISAGQTAGGTHASLPDGGAGGIRQTPPGSGQPGTSATMDGGGGGGSVGQARFNTTSGLINPQNGAAIYSQYTTATLRTRLVPP